MLSRALLFIFIMTALLFMGAEDSTAKDYGKGGVKAYGVIHNIAEDRQIERIGGKYEPEGLDKYIKRKFDLLSEEIAGLEEKLNNMKVDLTEIKSMVQQLA